MASITVRTALMRTHLNSVSCTSNWLGLWLNVTYIYTITAAYYEHKINREVHVSWNIKYSAVLPLHLLTVLLCTTYKGICGDQANSYLCQDEDGYTCISRDSVCNEVSDCPDGTDEKPFLSDATCIGYTGRHLPVIPLYMHGAQLHLLSHHLMFQLFVEMCHAVIVFIVLR